MDAHRKYNLMVLWGRFVINDVGGFGEELYKFDLLFFVFLFSVSVFIFLFSPGGIYECTAKKKSKVSEGCIL